MKDDGAGADALAASLLDGEAVDWPVAERELTDELDPPTFDALKELEAIVRACRTGLREAPELRSRWGDLQLLARLGGGACADVYRARDEHLDREVALKVLRRPFGRRGLRSASLLEEGRLLARVHHLNVVTVYRAEEFDGRVGLWMELIHGTTLAGVLAERGALGAAEAALIGIDLCRALAAIHRAGLVHGDVKARNVMREDGGRTVLMDFGSARVPFEAWTDVTVTPLYAAPEVLEGASPSPRSDLYSLGVLLFHLVTQAYPTSASDLPALLEAHRRAHQRRLRDLRPDLPDAFVRAVERALAAESARFASAGEMEAALAESLASAPLPAGRGRRERAPRVFSMVAAGAGLCALLFCTARTREPSRAEARVPSTNSAPATTGGPTAFDADPGRIYEVQAGLYKNSPRGVRRLESGDRVSPGDELFLEVQASRALHFYVLNEDERGASYLLFPLPGHDLANPLPAGVLHHLPGSRAARPFFWQVTSAGGREHFLVVASPDRLLDLEREAQELARPDTAKALHAVSVPAARLESLRGIGGLVEGSAPNARSGHVFDMARRLGGRAQAEGPWVREFVLENPGS